LSAQVNSIHDEAADVRTTRAVQKTYRNPQQSFPPRDVAGEVNGAAPKIGATFLSASAQGLEAWPKAWARIMGSSDDLT